MPAPNGSTIIICGHHQGITIIWRGGRPYKRPQSRNDTRRDGSHLNKTDGNTHQGALAAGETEEVEFDPTEPYDKIVSSKMLEVDSDVLRISVPPVPSDLDAQTSHTMPNLLKEEMMFTAACADGSIRIFKLPLDLHDSYRSKNDVSVVVQPNRSPFAISRGMSLTWTGQQDISSAREEESSPSWSLLLANATAAAGGSLTVYQAELPAKRSGAFRWHVVQEESLRQAPHLVRFNSSCYPSTRHTQLLISMPGVLKLYEPLPRTRFHQDPQELQAGAWLLSLNVPFNSATTTQSELGQRLRILDAQWTCDGKCLVVLLEDGQWGLWDMGAMNSQPVQRGKRTNIMSSGMSGGGITRFAISGYLGENAAAMVAKLNLGGGQSHSKDISALTPMTPNTRKTKQQALFSGSTATAMHNTSQGGVSVRRLETPTVGSTPDDAIVMWYKSILYTIPSLMTFWKDGGVNSAGTTPQPIDGFSSFNENVTSVSQVGEGKSYAGSSQDMVVSTEHRLLMLQPERTARTFKQTLSQSENSAIPQKHSNGIFAATTNMDLDENDVVARDQDLLLKNQLDLGGLDRMLSTMNEGRDSPSGLFGARGGSKLGSGLFSQAADSRTRRVGFAAGI